MTFLQSAVKTDITTWDMGRKQIMPLYAHYRTT